MKNKPRTSNLQSACRLSLTTRRVYSQELALPEGVEAITVTPSAGEELLGQPLYVNQIQLLYFCNEKDHNLGHENSVLDFKAIVFDEGKVLVVTALLLLLWNSINNHNIIVKTVQYLSKC